MRALVCYGECQIWRRVIGEASKESVLIRKRKTVMIMVKLSLNLDFCLVINQHWRQCSLQCVKARLCIQIPRMKIHVSTMEKNVMWKHMNKGRDHAYISNQRRRIIPFNSRGQTTVER